MSNSATDGNDFDSRSTDRNKRLSASRSEERHENLLLSEGDPTGQQRRANGENERHLNFA